jgi:hypothetical protein
VPLTYQKRREKRIGWVESVSIGDGLRPVSSPDRVARPGILTRRSSTNGDCK